MKKKKYQIFTIGSSQTGKTAFSEEMARQAKERGLSVTVFKLSEKLYPTPCQNIPPEMLLRPMPQFTGLQMPELTPFNTKKTCKNHPKFPYIQIPSEKTIYSPWHEDC